MLERSHFKTKEEYDIYLGFVLEIPKKFDSYKSRAKTKNIPFELSFNLFDTIVKHKCFYCKYDPFDKPNGIDRFDNTKGYVKGNCVPCCWTCNRAKSSMKPDEYFDYIERFK